MSDADVFRRQADDLLRQATMTVNLGERSRLISQAVWLHAKADEPEELSPQQQSSSIVIPFSAAPWAEE